MPVQYIPEEPTLGGNIGGGISRGVAAGMQDLVSRRQEERKDARRKQELLAKRHQKLSDTATNFVSKYIKEFDSDMPPSQREALQQRYLELLSQAELSGQDVDPNQLLQMAVNQSKEQQMQASTQAKPDFFSSEGYKQRGQRFSKERGYDTAFDNLMGLLKERPSALGTEALVGGSKAAEGLAQFSDPTNMIGNVMGMLTGNKALQPSELIAPRFREGLSPESTKGAEDLSNIYELLAGVIPIERIASLGSKAAKGAGTALETLLGKIGVKAEQFGARTSSTAAREAAINAEGILSGSAAKTEAAVEQTVSNAAKEMIPSEASIKPLTGRVSEKAPKPETVARVERQEARPFKKEAEIKLRETQLKEYPEYEAEILKDRAEMQGRRADKEPKTERGLAGRAKRQAAAEADLPGVQRVYQNAAARVRGLENELAAQPGNKQIQEVLEVAKSQLKDAEFLHKQTLSNAKLGESKVGKDAMRDAARKKTMEISDKIAAGEEVELAKMDYNPELVKKGKAISKRKPLKAKKTSDFHTEVHDTYGDVYRERLGQLDKQIKDLAKNKSMSSLHQRQVLDKERKVLKKLIDHVDAESAIHRHNLGLRERFERQKALSRFKQAGKSTPVKETQKTKEAVKGKFDMKKSTQRAVESPKQAGEAAKEVSEEAARMNPKQSVQIEQETPAFQKTMSEAPPKTETSGLIRDIGEAKTPKEATQKVSKLASDWRDFFQKLRKLSPSIFKTNIAKSFAVGFAVDSIQEAIKEVTGNKISKIYLNQLVSSAAGISGAVGGGGLSGLGARGGAATLGMGASHYLVWKPIRKAIIRSAAKKRDRDELFRLKKKYGPKLVKEVTDELR